MGVVGEVLGIRGGVVGEVLGILRAGGSRRRSFRNSREVDSRKFGNFWTSSEGALDRAHSAGGHSTGGTHRGLLSEGALNDGHSAGDIKRGALHFSGGHGPKMPPPLGYGPAPVNFKEMRFLDTIKFLRSTFI